jgi:hypothetical protein
MTLIGSLIIGVESCNSLRILVEAKGRVGKEPELVLVEIDEKNLLCGRFAVAAGQ